MSSYKGTASLFVGAALTTIFLAGALLVGAPVLQDSLVAEGAGSSILIFRAGEIAYRDFTERIGREIDSSSPLSKFLGSVSNYEINLREDVDSYVVTFLPTRYEGRTVRGGGAEYRIDKKELRVNDVIRFK